MILLKFNDRNDNLGDRLIFNCLYEELQGVDKVQFYLSAPADATTPALRFRHAYWKALILALKGERTTIVHPPGARITPRNLPTESAKRKIKEALIHRLWKLINAKIVIAGISVDRDRIPQRYRRFDAIGVRDLASLQHLSSVHRKVAFCPDMAFLKPPSKPERLGNCLLMSFRSETPDNYYSREYRFQIESALKALSPLISEVSKIGFFAHVDEDARFNKQLSTLVSSFNSATDFLPDRPTNFDYRSFFSGYSVVMSNRLHVLLPALSEGLLGIALISRDHHKIINLFTSIGLDHHILYADDPDILARARKLLEQRKTILDTNYNILLRLRMQAKAYIRQMVTT